MISILSSAVLLVTLVCSNLISALPLDIHNFYALNSLHSENNYPKIKMVVFTTGSETPEQLEMLPKLHSIVDRYGGFKLEEREIPSGGLTYASSANIPLHYSWYKIQVARDLIAENPTAEWILTFELFALPTDGSEQVNLAELVQNHPCTSVFLKRVGSNFGMFMFKNNEDTKKQIELLWELKSSTMSVAQVFESFMVAHPQILDKVTLL